MFPSDEPITTIPLSTAGVENIFPSVSEFFAPTQFTYIAFLLDFYTLIVYNGSDYEATAIIFYPTP